MKHVSPHCTRGEKMKLENEKVNIECNGVKHVSSCFTMATWPPVAWPPPCAGGIPAGDASARPVPAAVPQRSPVPALVPDPLAPAVAPPVAQGEPVAAPDDCPTWEQAEPPGPPCPTCSGLAYWLDLRGGRHCQNCEAGKLARAVRLLATAARIRERKERSDETAKTSPRAVATRNGLAAAETSTHLKAFPAASGPSPSPPGPTTRGRRPDASSHSRRSPV